MNKDQRIVELEAEVLEYKLLVADMTASLDIAVGAMGYHALPPVVALEVIQSNILEFPLARVRVG